MEKSQITAKIHGFKLDQAWETAAVIKAQQQVSFRNSVNLDRKQMQGISQVCGGIHLKTEDFLQVQA